jgi:hypothetical protein
VDIITHIAVLVFTVIVILGVGAFVVIDVFGRVDYLKDKAPWLEKALERRGALGVLLVAAIFLVIGDGYELINKEVPAVPAAPTVEIKGPRAHDISKCEIVRVVEPGTGKPELQPGPQMNLPEKVCPPPTVVYQPGPGSPPPTQLEKLTQANKNLPPIERNQVAGAFIDYAKFLEQGSALYYKANAEGGQIQQDRLNGSIAKDFEAHIRTLHEMKASAETYANAFRQVRDKWKYYPDEAEYIFGDNPDNLGPYMLMNGVDAYANYLENWAKISNKNDQSVLILLANQQNNFNDSLDRFIKWVHVCQQRFEAIKKSIQ